MALNFPISPSIDDEYTYGNTTWRWNGTVWTKLSVSIIKVTATLTTGAWTLVSGLYEQSISNANITASSVVDIIPDNANAAIVKAAEFMARTDSSSGSVKVYCTNLPSGNIGVTLNIFN